MKYRVTKRFLDLFLAILLLPLVCIISIPIAIAIKMHDGGAVLIRQKRIGKNAKQFYCYKFRTMKENTPTVARKDLGDPSMHVTKVGKTLRKYGLDEIAQIINVLLGQMSFVGPRPLLLCEEPVHRMRADCGIYTVLPGITGLCQITCRDPQNAYERVCVDYEYFCRKSLLFDALIMFYTLFPSKNKAKLI